MKIIFAQGNPEPNYVNTRHNIGFSVLNHLVKDLNLKWTEKSKFQAITAETTFSGEKILFVKPTTFYNETGIAARKIIDFYKLDPIKDLLVIHDDFALPFGTIRVRQQGNDAGNNGIKSLNMHLNSNYNRIRVGIWTDQREKMDDADFVLAKFNNDESTNIKNIIIPKIIELINMFCNETLESTSYKTIE